MIRNRLQSEFMKKISPTVLIACLFSVAGIWAGWHSFLSKPSQIVHKSETVSKKDRAAIPARNPTFQSLDQAAAQAVNPEATAAIVKAREAAIELMHDAAITYDKAQLPIIQSYLVNADPELRAAAVDCMIILGDASAGPMLREAARKLDSAEEAKDFEKKADYVELPPADFNKRPARVK